VRLSTFLAGTLSTLLLVATATLPAGGSLGTPFARDAIDYLKTQGLLPLWAGVTRPVLPWSLEAAFDIGQAMQRAQPPSAQDLAVFRLLDPAFHASDFPGRQVHYTTETSVVAPFGMSRNFESLSAATVGALATGGWAVNSPTAMLAVESNGVSWLAGRTPLGWGPAPLGSELHFDETAGGFDALQVSFVWLKARFTKVVGWLDAGRSIVGTRMDIPYRPNLRLGFGESVLMQGSPYLPYLLNPIPIGINPPLFAQIRNPQGIYDDFFLTADMDWVPTPGLRVFGEVLVDDVTSPTATANFPSRWGFSGGFHIVSEDGSSVQGMYTMVLNWTYTEGQGPPYAWLLRGLPMGHVLGCDFDLIHLRWMATAPPSSSTWVAYVRKGEGKVGVFFTSQAEAWQKLFLSGVVEHSLMAGFDTPFDSAGWIGKIGPWAAYRVNADHVPGATRVDWGVNLEAAWSN
jgi:hypothetical protein